MSRNPIFGTYLGAYCTNSLYKGPLKSELKSIQSHFCPTKNVEKIAVFIKGQSSFQSRPMENIFDDEIRVSSHKYAQKVTFYPCSQQFVIVFLGEIREKLSFTK